MLPEGIENNLCLPLDGKSRPSLWNYCVYRVFSLPTPAVPVFKTTSFSTGPILLDIFGDLQAINLQPYTFNYWKLNYKTTLTVNGCALSWNRMIVLPTMDWALDCGCELFLARSPAHFLILGVQAIIKPPNGQHNDALPSHVLECPGNGNCAPFTDHVWVHFKHCREEITMTISIIRMIYCCLSYKMVRRWSTIDESQDRKWEHPTMAVILPFITASFPASYRGCWVSASQGLAPMTIVTFSLLELFRLSKTACK